MAVDREFVYILCMCIKINDLLCSFGCLLTYFCLVKPTLGYPWVHLGNTWTTFGRQGLPWGSPWAA